MSTTVITNSVTASAGFAINDNSDYLFTLSSLREATGVNAEGIVILNGDDTKSIVTVAGTVIGNRVGIQMDGMDVLHVTQTALVRDERAFGILTTGDSNDITVSGFVLGTDSGIELNSDNNRVTITETGVVSGAHDESIGFRPAGINMPGDNNVLINAGTITVGANANGQPAVTNRINGSASDESAILDATVINIGSIFGDVVLGAGEDIYDARGGGFVTGRIDLGDNNDMFKGGALDEDADGGAGADTMSGGHGDDTLNGEAGNDVLRGSQGEDKLVGGNGNDILRGGRGNDDIRAGGGGDTLYGDNGNDELTGGGGNDVFVFRAGFGSDTINDFNDKNAEKIDLSDVAAVRNFNDLVNNHLSSDGPDAIITVGENSIRLDGFNANNLDNGDFIF